MNNSQWEWTYRKVIFILLQATFGLTYAIAYCYSIVYRNPSKKSKVQKIAAVWYNPADLTGSNLRLGHWEKYFKMDGLEYDNYAILTIKEVQEKFENAKWSSKYLFYLRTLIKRFQQFFKLKKYDVVWIDRGFIPYYPLKSAFFEKCIKRMVPYLVIDSSDGGDFQNNPDLIRSTLKSATRVTVAFKYLQTFFSELHPDIVQINWTIPSDNYKVKTQYELGEPPVLGWMGSPANFKHVLGIRDSLIKLAEQYDFKFVYICRENMNFDIPGAIVEHHRFGADYYDLLHSFDIGLSPFLVSNLRTKGKIAMKHQEFLLCGIPQVCSPVAISEYVEDWRDVMISFCAEEWFNKISTLLKSKTLREQLGKASREIYLQHYTYRKEYKKLKNALTQF